MDDNKNNGEEFQFKFMVVSKLFGVIELLIKNGMIVGCCFIAYLALGELAGQSTEAKFELFLDVLSKEKESILPWLLAAGTSIWAIGERRLRFRKVEHFHKHTKNLEEVLDENRTGSRLTHQGKTNPEDRL